MYWTFKFTLYEEPVSVQTFVWSFFLYSFYQFLKLFFPLIHSFLQANVVFIFFFPLSTKTIFFLSFFTSLFVSFIFVFRHILFFYSNEYRIRTFRSIIRQGFFFYHFAYFLSFFISFFFCYLPSFLPSFLLSVISFFSSKYSIPILSHIPLRFFFFLLYKNNWLQH